MNTGLQQGTMSTPGTAFSLCRPGQRSGLLNLHLPMPHKGKGVEDCFFSTPLWHQATAPFLRDHKEEVICKRTIPQACFYSPCILHCKHTTPQQSYLLFLQIFQISISYHYLRYLLMHHLKHLFHPLFTLNSPGLHSIWLLLVAFVTFPFYMNI